MIAGEQSFYATPTLPLAASLTLRQNFSRSTAAVLAIRGERLAARGSPPNVPFVPVGNRTLWQVSLGVVLER